MLMKVFERYFSRNPVSRQLSFEADTAVKFALSTIFINGYNKSSACGL